MYRRALTQQRGRGEWHARLGRLLADQGREAEAITALERAVSLGDPVNPPPVWLAPAHRQLGDLLRGRDRARARHHYQRFLDLSPSTGAGVADVRAALAELGR
jgi:Tfp pilus assembly protein PilF